ncbi:uncharacterized protein Dmoj_GI25687 [Drosophila mojavensis]|uniref:Uncharacterized protein n=1 Tax=Drosophila mojavensis TaxID=7230 RepID=A0A0Q9XLZ6_DROMO|nr:uncharacterized protein Dmoj_GI25687 [Drosophila mojavensis]
MCLKLIFFLPDNQATGPHNGGKWGSSWRGQTREAHVAGVHILRIVSNKLPRIFLEQFNRELDV